MNKINTLKKYFIATNKFYYNKTDQGQFLVKGYNKLPITLKENDIINHINKNKILVCVPYHLKQNDHRKNMRCRWVCIDLDIHDNFSSDALKKLEKKIDIVISWSEEYFRCESKYIIKEGTKRGFHLWIILKPNTLLKDAWDYRELIRPNLEKYFGEVELNPKQKSLEGINFGISTFGNGVGIPYNKYSKIKEDLEVHELEIKDIIKDYRTAIRESKKYLPKTVKAYNITYRQIPLLEKSENIPIQLKNIYDSPILDKCVKNVIDGSFQCHGDAGNSMRVRIATKLLKIGLDCEIIALCFSNQTDFDYNKSLYHVNKIKEKTYTATCKRIKALGYCDPTCWQCGASSKTLEKKIKLPQEIEGWIGLHEKMNELIKSKKRYFIRKTTRSGTTSATIIQAIKNKKRLLMIAPTNKIYTDTLFEAIDLGVKQGIIPILPFIQTYRIKSNVDTCERIRRELGDRYEDFLKTFPFALMPRCNKCNIKKKCRFQLFLKNIDKYQIIYISTQKLKALIGSASESTQSADLLNTLIDWCDLMFIDECSHLFTVNFKSRIIRSSDINFMEDCEDAINEFLEIYPDYKDTVYLEMLNKFLKRISTIINEEFINLSYAKFIELSNELFREYFKKDKTSWRKWYSIFCLYFKKTKNYKIRYIVEAFLATSSQKIYLQHLSPSMYHSRRIIMANVDNMQKLLQWLNKINKPIIITDAVYPPIKLEKVFNNLEEININDPMGTAKKQTIIICKGSDPFFGLKIKKAPEKEEKLRNFLETYGITEETFLVSQSKDIANYVYSILRGLELTKVKEKDWHRGVKTIGVKSDLRRMMLCGSSHIPHHVYDYIADIYLKNGYLEEYKTYEEAGKYLENYDARSAFFQSISRVKDPKGEKKSEVFVFGMPKSKIKRWLEELGISVPEVITEKEYLIRQKSQKMG